MRSSKIALIYCMSALCLGLSLAPRADFARQAAFTPGLFADVPESEWYASSVSDAYEFGLMNGDSAVTFSPNGTLSVAEGITVASRIREKLTGESIGSADGEWYAPYVAYAVKNGLCTENTYDDYDRPIRRAEIAVLLSRAADELPKINEVTYLPDVIPGEPYSADILRLYRAGILAGNDEYGTFAPDSNLLRCEFAAMSVRIADSTKRVSKTFAPISYRALGDAYPIIDDEYSTSIGSGLANGWQYDNRHDYYNTDGKDKDYIIDMSDEKAYRLIRDFNEETGGLLHLDLIVGFTSADGCTYIAFEDGKDNRVVSVTERNGCFVLEGSTACVTDVPVATVSLELELDLDKNTARAVINNVPTETVSIPDLPVSRLVLGTNEKGTGTVSLKYCKLGKNYALYEHFTYPEPLGENVVPADWEITGDVTVHSMLDSVYPDIYSAVAKADNNKPACAVRRVEPMAGRILYQTYLLLPQKADGASVSLLCGDDEALTVETISGAFMCGDTVLHTYQGNVWQLVRIEADTESGSARILIDGKLRAEVPFAAKTVDGVKISFAPTTGRELWFDDVELSVLHEHADYPSAPVVSASDEYNVGLNVCYLWHDQVSGEGWDSVSAFPEFDTYLGYYDEGLAETADWELKWMAEHGIDFINACWYCPQGNQTAPIKKMKTSYSALHDGYMNAKYSDLVDFSIMWENGGGNVSSLEQFKDIIWKYWKEYYFSDERYVRLDNRALLTVWYRDTFIKCFGGEEGAREAIAFMNEDIKSLGYDGMVIWFANNGIATSASFEQLDRIGADGFYAYHWGSRGAEADYQILCNSENARISGSSHAVPVVSIGFNDVGRNQKRSPLISPEDHLAVCQSIRELCAASQTGTWRDNTVMISTWNEFSEGTYIFPTASTGFDYLDNIRSVFTSDASDHASSDAKPTDAQVARVNHLYPPHHAPIRRLQNEPADAEKAAFTPEDLTPVLAYDMSVAADAAKWEAKHGISDFSRENGVLSGTGAGSDFGIISGSQFGFKASDAKVIHIRMKTTDVSEYEIFFTTSSDGTWDEKKHVLFPITAADTFVDYYADMTRTGLWNGSITAVRIDPMTSPGSFEIECIEFMSYPERDASEIPGVVVNGRALSFPFEPVIGGDGEFIVVGEQRNSAFYSSMRLLGEWDRFTGDGVLTLHTYAGKTVVLTVGSDEADVDGNAVKLKAPFTLRDGLPVFRMKELCGLLGYPCTAQGNTLKVQAAKDDEYAVLTQSKEHNWEFEIDGEPEKWMTSNVKASVHGGFFGGTATSIDPTVSIDTEFAASRYTHIAVGVRYTELMKTAVPPQLFFKTQSSNRYTADKCVDGVYHTEGKKEGDVVEVLFDLSTCSAFSGVITGIRFDPFEAVGDFAIDYIRCINAPDRLYEGLIDIPENGLAFTFSSDSDIIGWSGQQCTPYYRDGCLFGAVDNNDPAVSRAVSFDANDYQYAIATVRYSEELANSAVDFYFKTKNANTYTADKWVSGRYLLPDGVMQGDPVRVVFDLTKCKKYKGEITAIRFDPVDSKTDFYVESIVFAKKIGYEPPAPADLSAIKVTEPTSCVITDVSDIPEGITVAAECADLMTGPDPAGGSDSVFFITCNREDSVYTYFDVFMQFERGKNYDISYQYYPLSDYAGNPFDSSISFNMRYGTDGEEVSDHTVGTNPAATGDGWKTMHKVISIDDDYVPCAKDCFQVWSIPQNGHGLSYCVKDIQITPKS